MTKLTDLTDVNITSPHQGDALIWNDAAKQWFSGPVADHLVEWDNSTLYSFGTTVHYKGGVFRATKDNRGTPPEYINGAAMLFRRANPAGTGEFTGPFSIEYVHTGVADTTVAPTDVPTTNVKHLALQYKSDSDWSVWVWDLIVPPGWKPTDPVPVYQWHNQSDNYKISPNGVKVWREYSLPPTYYADYSLWIYGGHASTHVPVVGQNVWTIVPMRYDLKAAHDVEAYDPKKGDILEFDPTWSTWKATDALEQLKKRVAALEAAPPPPAPAPGFDLATAKQLIGLGALDTSKDLTITDLLATTQELVEAYLGRKFSGTHTEHFSTSNNFDRVYLKGYPVNTITSVKNMDGDDITYTARKSFGIIKLSQVQSRDSEVEVVYSGGLVVDAPLLRVMWKLFLAFYNADLSTTTGSLSGVSSINIPDVGTITFGGNSGASARYAVLGGNLDPNIAWVLDRYKSEIIGGI